MSVLSERIKDLRSEKNISQKFLADKIFVRSYTIADWEQGRAEPSSEYLIALSRFFNVSVDYLLGLEDDLGIKQDFASPIDLEDLNLLKKFKSLSIYTQNAFRIQIDAMYEKEREFDLIKK